MNTSHRPECAAGGRFRWSEALPTAALRVQRERHIARRISCEALRIYREVAEAAPELSGRALYREVIRRQTSLDADGAGEILEQAETNCAVWPAAQPLRFRDVVQYLVTRDRFRRNPTVLDSRALATPVVADIIPDEL